MKICNPMNSVGYNTRVTSGSANLKFDSDLPNRSLNSQQGVWRPVLKQDTKVG